MIRVTDVDKSIAFFDLLGLKEVKRFDSEQGRFTLVYLAARLIHGGFRLLDTQFVTEHLKQFGTIEIDRTAFHRRLEQALGQLADFNRLPIDAPPEDILRIIAAAHRST